MSNTPVNVCDNEVAVGPLGNRAQCVSVAQDPVTVSTPDDGGKKHTVVVDAPVTVCGNGVAVLHDANGKCAKPTPREPVKGGDSGVRVHAPVTVCGNAVAVLADASGKCVVTKQGITPDVSVTPPNGSPIGGKIDVSIPVTLCDIAIPIGGTATTECTEANGPTPVVISDPPPNTDDPKVPTKDSPIVVPRASVVQPLPVSLPRTGGDVSAVALLSAGLLGAGFAARRFGRATAPTGLSAA